MSAHVHARPQRSLGREACIVLAHGGGGQLAEELLADLVLPRLGNPILAPLDDAALLPMADGRLAFTTDSFVVQPLEFPGGDIGRLAVCGTVNDLAVCGAVPQFLSLALILEEGLPLDLLRRLVDSIAVTADEAGVRIVTGDTKVVGRGQADGVYINTAGVGLVRPGCSLTPARIRPGDRILLSGTVADHGMAVMLRREEGLGFVSELRSDVAPISGLVSFLLDACGDDIVFLRDPTRGGLSGVVAGLAESTGMHLELDEARIPIRPGTRYTADMLGLDPLDVANEGKVVAVVRARCAAAGLEAMRRHPLGRHAQDIGVVTGEADGLCELITHVGGRRVLQKPYGEELPRIC